MMRVWAGGLALVAVLHTQAVYAADRYISPAGSDSNTCTQAQDIDTPKRTWASVKACMAPGDTTYIASGTYNEMFDMQGLTGTSTALIRVIGYGATRPWFVAQQTSTTCRSILTSSTTRWQWIEYIKFSGEGICPDAAGVQVITNRVENASNITFKNTEWSWFNGSFIIKGSSNITFSGGLIHDAISDCVLLWRHQGIYINKDVTNIIVEGMHIYNMPGGGIQAYPGSINGIIIRKNKIHHNAWCTTTPQGGIAIYRDNTATGPISGVEVYDNVIYKNASPTGGRAHGIKVGGDIVGAKLYNNTVVYNENNSADGALAYGIRLESATCPAGSCYPSNTEIKNNLVLGNEGGQIYTTGTTGTVLSGNISSGVGADYFVNVAADDYRLKQGTNAARDAGVAVSTRPSPVGPPDVGAWEQGNVGAASVVGGFIEAVVNIMNSGVQPTSAITAWSVACVGCTGSPVVSSAVVKAATSNIVQLTISGLVTSGTCTVSYGAGNMTDAGYIGGLLPQDAQGVNSVSGRSVSGICVNSAGGAPPSGPYLYHRLDDGSGTSAVDASGNGRTGTLSGSPTWISPALQGGGVYFPNDGVDRRLTTAYGNAINPTAQSFTVCLSGQLDAGLSNKIVAGSANGTNQRWYVGTYTGQTWQLGIQTSTFSSTGESEFPVTNKYTRLCVVADASIDTATLVVNGVMGTSAAAKKTYTSFLLASNILAGCGFSATVYCGGYAIDEMKIWDRALSQSELVQDFEEFNPAGLAVTCYGQATHKAEHVFTDGTNPIAYGQSAASSYEVVDGGGIAAVIQIDCTGTAGGSVTLRFYYSTNGSDFDNEIPATLGAGGIAMWGPSNELGLNHGVATCCISGGLAANHGVTLVASNVSPTITLSTNHSYTIRLLIRFASGLVDQSRWIVAKEDTGLALANAPTLGPMRFNLVNPRGGGMR